jgi:hypothetical protein
MVMLRCLAGQVKMKRQQWLVVKADAGKSRAQGWRTMQMA